MSKRAAPDDNLDSAAAQPKRAREAIVFPSGDFSEWVYDEGSGWNASPDGVWQYNPETFVFFHSQANEYYTYDGSTGGYAQVSCSYGPDGQLYISPMDVAPPLEPEVPKCEVLTDSAQMKGRRPKQEDRFTTLADVSELLATAGCVNHPLPATFLGIYDGHSGWDAAEFATEQLHKDIAKRLAEHPTPWSDEVVVAANKAAYVDTDTTFLDWARARRRTQDGATAISALLLGDRIFVSWIGDSRAVLCDSAGKAVRMSHDHKPNVPLEKARVVKAGGSCVLMNKTWRVISPAGVKFMVRYKKNQVRKGEKLPMQLAVSRAFGDLELKEPVAVVIAEPEVTCRIIDPEAGTDKYIVLACDGIWDVCTDQQVVDLVSSGLTKGLDPKDLSRQIVNMAHEMGSGDNLTATVLLFDFGSSKSAHLLPLLKRMSEEASERREIMADKQAKDDEARRQYEEETALRPALGSTRKMTMPGDSPREPCKFEVSARGCRMGDRCRFSHSYERQRAEWGAPPVGDGGPPREERRIGDWECPKCYVNVFASKVSCFKCGTPKTEYDRARAAQGR